MCNSFKWIRNFETSSLRFRIPHSVMMFFYGRYLHLLTDLMNRRGTTLHRVINVIYEESNQ